MYSKPRVERFGTFRELTRVGFNGQSDGYTVNGVTDSGNDQCASATAPGCTPRTGSA